MKNKRDFFLLVEIQITIFWTVLQTIFAKHIRIPGTRKREKQRMNEKEH
jgi:hypothetical protein